MLNMRPAWQRLRFPFYLGLRCLFRRGGGLAPHLAGSIVGIALSLIPFIVVLEVSQGMIEGITRRYLEVGTYHLQVFLPGERSPDRFAELRARLEGSADVRFVLSERQGTGLLVSNRGRSGVTLRAVSPDLYREDEGFRTYFRMLEGTFSLEEPDSILLGKEIAAILGVSPGDSVKLLAGFDPLSRRLPRIASFRVKGVFSTGYQEMDKAVAYIPLATGKRVLPAAGSSQFLGIKLKDPFLHLEEQARSISRLLPPEAQVYTWYQLEKANYVSFQTTQALLIFIMVVIVLVAVANISSSMIMVVLERSRDIAILKGIGAHSSDIRLTFLLAGFLTGLAGALPGLVLGILLAVNINEVLAAIQKSLDFLAALASLAASGRVASITLFNADFYLERIPIRFHALELFSILFLTLLVSVFASYLPARRAGATRPLEILRKI